MPGKCSYLLYGNTICEGSQVAAVRCFSGIHGSLFPAGRVGIQFTPVHGTADEASFNGAMIDSSSFLGLFTRVEIGHIVICSGSKG